MNKYISLAILAFLTTNSQKHIAAMSQLESNISSEESRILKLQSKLQLTVDQLVSQFNWPNEIPKIIVEVDSDLIILMNKLFNMRTPAAIEIQKNILHVNSETFSKYSTDAQLFILGHEIGHVNQNHVKYIPNIIGLFSLLIPESQKLSNYITWPKNRIFDFIKQSEEFDADKRSIQALKTNKGALEFFDIENNKLSMKIKLGANICTYICIGSHPSISSRKQAVLDFVLKMHNDVKKKH